MIVITVFVEENSIGRPRENDARQEAGIRVPSFAVRVRMLKNLNRNLLCLSRTGEFAETP